MKKKTQKNKQYEVLCAGEWIRCKKAAEVKDGWLHYQLSDGTNGLAQPKNWREKKDE